MAEDFSRRLYVPNFDQWKSNLLRNRLSDRSLGVKVIEHGIVLPARWSNNAFQGGVCDQEFKFVAGFSRIDGGGAVGQRLRLRQCVVHCRAI